MAGDLVVSPDIEHTTAHDLESFFWLLMWVVVRCVNTGWETGERTVFINDTMSPRVFGTGTAGVSNTGSRGTGGDAKIKFLRNKRSHRPFRSPPK